MTPYRDLPVLPGLGLPHAWQEFGVEDQLGTINLLTPERVHQALQLPKLGKVFNLSLPLNEPDPPMFGRKRYEHVIHALGRNEQDDYVNGLHLQASSQWDGLRHIRARELGFYGGRSDAQAGPNGDQLGVEKWAEHGIVGRGVLLDVASHLAALGEFLNPWDDTPITVPMLKATAARQHVTFTDGDILLVRTGWMEAYRGLERSERAALSGAARWPGLRGDAAMAEFLWDSHFAAVAVDNPAVEDSPGDSAVGSLHRRVIPLLGLALGELWVLDELATFATRHKRWDSCIVSVPLNLPNGVGSPANAIAIV